MLIYDGLDFSPETTILMWKFDDSPLDVKHTIEDNYVGSNDLSNYLVVIKPIGYLILGDVWLDALSKMSIDSSKCIYSYNEKYSIIIIKVQ